MCVDSWQYFVKNWLFYGLLPKHSCSRSFVHSTIQVFFFFACWFISFSIALSSFFFSNVFLHSVPQRRGSLDPRTHVPTLRFPAHTCNSRSKGRQGSDTALPPASPKLLWEAALETPGLLECPRMGGGPGSSMPVAVCPVARLGPQVQGGISWSITFY